MCSGMSKLFSVGLHRVALLQIPSIVEITKQRSEPYHTAFVSKINCSRGTARRACLGGNISPFSWPRLLGAINLCRNFELPCWRLPCAICGPDRAIGQLCESVSLYVSGRQLWSELNYGRDISHNFSLTISGKFGLS